MSRSGAKCLVLLASSTLVAPLLAQWEQRQPATSPSAREGCAMAFDSRRQRTVLFGGSGTGAVLGDTWEWDGTNWTRVTTVVSPPPRQHAAMAFDPVRGQIVLFGGANVSARLGDTWTYDGTAWTPRTPSASPSARRQVSMAWERNGNRLLLFGGTDGTTSFNDTWVWNGSDWASAASPIRPFPRWGHALADEPGSGGVLLFGGFALQGGVTSLNDTWRWTGTEWSSRTPSFRPTARGGHVMFAESSRARIVLYGGAYVTTSSLVPLPDTLLWNEAFQSWSTAFNLPSGRSDMGAAEGPTGAVMFGGRGTGAELAETWVLRQVPQPVFPLGYERREGNEAYGGTFATQHSRTQVAMAAEGFDPAFRSGTIRGIRFRRDVAGPTFPARQVTMRLYVGATSRSPRDLSTRFFDNWQATPTLVYQGMLDLPDQPPSGSPVAPFAVPIPFQVPFVWSGATLLYDIEVLDNSLPTPLELDAATQAHAQGAINRFGQPCRGPNGSLPVFPAPPLARLIPGGGIDTNLSGATPGGLAISFVGDSTTSYAGVPLPFTFPGSTCTLYTSLVVSATQVVGTGGTAMASHPIPNDPRFAGLRAYAQWGVYEGASVYPPLTLTDAIQVIVGAVPPVHYEAVLNLDGSNVGVRLPGRHACLVCRLDF